MCQASNAADLRALLADNVFIERLWRSLKYQCVHLNASETGSGLRPRLGRWIGCHNGQRPHSRPGNRTPDEVCGRIAALTRMAA